MDEGWVADGGASAPEPLVIDEPPTQVVRRGGGRLRLVVVAVVAAALIAGVLAVIASSDPEVDPAEALAAAQAVVADTGSYRIEVLETREVVTGDRDGAGSETTSRIVTNVVVAGRDRWRVVVDHGDPMMGPGWEEIRIGDTLYSNTASFYAPEDGPQLPGPTWLAEPAELYEMTAEDVELAFQDLEEYPDDAYRLDLTLAAYFMQLDGDPTSMVRLVSAATDPVLEEELEDGTVVLRTRLAPLTEYERSSKEPIPSVDLTLRLDEADRPLEARFSASAGDATADVEVRFDDWGADLTVEPPSESDVDKTPWIQEEALAEADATLMVAPAVLPSGGWVLSDAYRLLADPEYEGCESVELTYSSDADRALQESIETLSSEELDASWQDLDYLSLSTSTLECMQEVDETPFDDELGGFPARGGDGFWEVQVGDASVYINTTLPREAIAPMVETLGPVTVDELAASIPVWVQELATSGGW
jgi:hypothetical protein